ncbi:MAG: SUMF1/EgtB/PvdO family nonheme iron enzyme [Flavobacterium sp.]|nr:SUMF1/EgtB/PvdO family nonheme iron enzyme [Flavobacterium sp.]
MKTKKLFSRLALTFCLFVFALVANANNVQITGTSVTGNEITFSISWDNSWNANVAPANWDAVWVFVKYQDCNTRLWTHAGLSTLSSDHSTSSPLQVDAVTDGRGVFVRRSALGGGTVPVTSVTLKMTIPAGTYNYKVYGIEMVNVPQSNFELGDGTSVSTFNSITVNAASQSGGINAATIGGGSTSLPNTYPVGYKTFYCMKTEVSQEQYIEYLNALTYDQQKAHTNTDPIAAAGTFAFNVGFGGRNGIRILTSGNNNAIPAVYASDATAGVENNIDDGQNVACNYLNWSDLSAYLDWAALRPMTELEYEKVCRGTMPRVAGEFAWGSTTLNGVYYYAIANALKANETTTTPLDGLCNVYINNTSVQVPVRVGFSASGSSGRASSGAAYYGPMEMSGNLSEMVINTTAQGVTFNGTLGDGTIAANGDANQATWPAPSTGLGSGYRGGDFNNYQASARVSDRAAITTVTTTRSVSVGGRGVR